MTYKSFLRTDVLLKIMFEKVLKCALWSDIFPPIYRIHLNAAPGFYFLFWVFGRGSIEIWPTWGCIWAGVVSIRVSWESEQTVSLLIKFFDLIYMYSQNTKVCLNSERLEKLKLLLTGEVGLYSSWSSIVSKLFFDWGCIRLWMGWGSIQEWGCIQANTVC